MAGGTLGAVHAAEARGYLAGSVACLDVGGTVLLKLARQTRDQRRSEGLRFKCGGQSPSDAIEMEAGARCGVVIRPFTAAAVVVVHGTIALGGGVDWARDANGRVLRAVLCNLARRATEGVRRVVARSTDRALAAALTLLEFAESARIARTLAGVGLDGARTARCLLLAARRRVVARVGLRALAGAGEVGGVGVRALLARQRRAGTLGAVRAGLAGDARLLALALLVRAGRALVAHALAGVGLDGAGAALGLLGAARRREVAHARRRALIVAGEVGGGGVRALLARQRRAGTLGAVRAGLAGDASLLALLGLVRAGFTLVARGHARVWRDRARAALGLQFAARWSKVAHVGLGALTVAGEVGGDGVRARQARQRNGRALGTVMALKAGCRRCCCLCAAREARWAKTCTRRALAGLVKGGGQAQAGRDVVVVDVVSGVHLAAFCCRLAKLASWIRIIIAAPLSPYLALGRGHPVARWRGQHVGGGAPGAEVEIRAVLDILRNAGGGRQTGAELGREYTDRHPARGVVGNHNMRGEMPKQRMVQNGRSPGPATARHGTQSARNRGARKAGSKAH
eukprot:scaffold44705_cov70-Phaeocystis_antarctica.AAC.6